MPSPTPAQIRFTPEDDATIARLRAFHRLPTVAATVRFALGVAEQALPRESPKKLPRKSRQTS